MAIIKGSDFAFYITTDSGKEIVCHATDFSMTVNTDEIEITGPADGAWRKFLPGLHNYTLSVPGLVAFTDPMNAVQLQDIQYSRKIVEWTAGLDPNGGLQYTGQMFITTMTITAQTRDAVKFDMAARGTGPQTILKNPITKSVYLSDRSGNRLAGCPNPYPVGVLWYDGTFIGPAGNEDEVISVFNEYAVSQGAFLTLVSYTGGCDFVMQVAWNSPLNPDVIYAVSAPGFALRGTMPNEAIGGAFDTNEVISA